MRHKRYSIKMIQNCEPIPHTASNSKVYIIVIIPSLSVIFRHIFLEWLKIFQSCPDKLVHVFVLLLVL